MSRPQKWSAEVDEKGRLILAPELAARYGLQPGARVYLDEDPNGVQLSRPVTHLAKVYIEPTSHCNLQCRTCIRNVWDIPTGQMASTTFAHIVEGLRAFSPPPTVFFGGFGEPLAHPDIVEMVIQVKGLGAQVELITNGTLLNEGLSQRLITAGLDALWVSLDGATPASYADVRLGAVLPQVIANLSGFGDSRRVASPSTPQIGIVFVAMKRNISDLPAVWRLAGQLGAKRFLVSNVLPYTAEMCSETLYLRALDDAAYQPPSMHSRHLTLPRIDVNELTREPLYRLMRSVWSVNFAGASLGTSRDLCPFVAGGATAISWDGRLSPCLPLLHDHTSFLNERERFSRRYAVGHVAESGLGDLWHAPEYITFRERVQAFDFSPCTICGGCEFAEGNEEDCFGNTFPTCGGCLWAQGVIRCP